MTNLLKATTPLVAILVLTNIQVSVTHIQETCLQFSTSVIGLKPYLDTAGVGVMEACKLFWYCRVTSELQIRTQIRIRNQIRNQEQNPEGKSKPRKNTILPDLPVKAVRFSCEFADHRKPYYDPKTCQCVSTNDHCHGDYNFNNKFACTRPYNLESGAGEQRESCRAFGKEETFYLNDFVHFDDPSKFWKCRGEDGSQSQGQEGQVQSPGQDRQNQEETVTNFPNSTFAESKDCPTGSLWNSLSCSCTMVTDQSGDAYRISEFNKHPMNRYNCAKILGGSILT